MKYALLFLLFPLQAFAEDRTATLNSAVFDHVLAGYRTFELRAHELRFAAQRDCDVTSDELRQAYHGAFDSWIRVSHLRFGPSEIDNRAFALAYWPDPKGFTPKILT